MVADGYAETAVPHTLLIPSPRLLALDENGQPIADAVPTSWRVPGAAYLVRELPREFRPATPPPADGQVGFQRKTQLSPQEQLAESTRSLGRMQQAASAVRKQLEEARHLRDALKRGEAAKILRTAEASSARAP